MKFGLSERRSSLHPYSELVRNPNFLGKCLILLSASRATGRSNCSALRLKVIVSKDTTTKRNKSRSSDPGLSSIYHLLDLYLCQPILPIITFDSLEHG